MEEYFGISVNWEGKVAIQISPQLDITPTPSESRGQRHARVETLGVEGTPAMDGIKLQKLPCRTRLKCI